MTNLNNLTKLIHKAVPSILDLKFGCKVNIGNKSTPHYVTVISCLSSNKYTYNQHTGKEYDGIQEIIEYKDNFTIERTPTAEIFEILGRDIMLEDVLVAIDDNLTGDYICGNGYLHFILDEEEEWLWKLNTPLHLQEQATIDFLFNLLKENDMKQLDIEQMIINIVWEATDGGTKLTKHSFSHFDEEISSLTYFKQAISEAHKNGYLEGLDYATNKLKNNL